MKIQYSQMLLIDFDKLIRNFSWFMSLNLIHADQNLGPECKAKMQELIKYSLDSNKTLVNFFTQPVLANEKKNSEKLIKNLPAMISFLYKYLCYAEPILQRCRPDIFSPTFAKLKAQYVEFNNKYMK